MLFPGVFFDFIKDGNRETRMNQILRATGCREGWLQGELFYYFHEKSISLSVNTELIGKRKKVDLFFKEDRTIAEIKIFGELNYQRKNITGRSRDINHFLDVNEVTDTDLRNVHKTEGSLLKDVGRLKSANSYNEKFMKFRKYMVLVVVDNTGNKKPDTFGKVIKTIQLSPYYTTEQFCGFQVRIWEIR